MKYRVLEKTVGGKVPVYLIQKNERVLWFTNNWVSICGYESKQTAIDTAKQFKINGDIKLKVVWVQNSIKGD